MDDIQKKHLQSFAATKLLSDLEDLSDEVEDLDKLKLMKYMQDNEIYSVRRAYERMSGAETMEEIPLNVAKDITELRDQVNFVMNKDANPEAIQQDDLVTRDNLSSKMVEVLNEEVKP